MKTEERDTSVDQERYPTTWWTRLDDGRIRCDVCPRACALHEGQTGLCFVRMRADDVLIERDWYDLGDCIQRSLCGVRPAVRRRVRWSRTLGRPSDCVAEQPPIRRATGAIL